MTITQVSQKYGLSQDTLRYYERIGIIPPVPRNKSGIKTWELKLRCEGGKRKILVVRDYGFELDCEEIKINPFKNRAERNDEILRLYNEKGLSQVFLASIFNISQPSVSLIINGKISKRK